MRTNRRLGVAVVVVLAAGGAATEYGLSRRARSGGGAGESRPAVTTDEPERDGWAIGARYAYRVEYLANAETSFRSGDQAVQQNAQVISFAGLLTATTIDVHNELRDLEMTFALDHFAVTGTPPETTEVIRRALAQPFVVSYDVTGIATRIHAPLRPDNGALNVMRDLASLLQVSNGTGPRWNSLEPELTGEVDVRYDRLAPDRLKKQKLEFRRVSQPAGVVAAARSPTVPRFVESEAYYHVDRGGRTMDLIANHVVNVSFAMEGLTDGQFRSGARASFKRTSASFDPKAARPGATLKLAHFGIMTDAQVLAGRQEARDRALVGTSATAEILSDIAAAVRGQEMGAAHPSMEKLSARVRLHPETLAEISRRDLGEQVLSAIGQAGTPAAQAKLSEVARDIGQPTDIRRFALDAFQDVAHPTNDSFQVLEEVAHQEKGPLKSSAVLSYGTLTLRQDENEPGTAGDKVRELASWFDAATTDEERAEIIEGLGNTRSVDALPTIERAIAWPTATVRTAAAHSLRLIPSGAADVLLAELLTGDTDARVRQAALFSVPYREFGAVAEPLGAVSRNDQSAMVRQAAVSALASFYHQRQPVKQAGEMLSWIAANDTVPEVRDSASAALKPAR